MAQHFDYVNKRVGEGKIFFTGACVNGAMGLIIYQAESFEDALEMFEKDPLIQSGLMETQLHPFKTGYVQTNDHKS
jgi:uncharacterized protein